MTRRGVSGAKALMASISLLILGAILGIVLDRHLMRSPIHEDQAVFHEAALAALQDRLELDSTQANAVDSIIRAHHAVLGQTWAALHTRLGATLDTVHRDIEAVLTSEQQTEFREWLADMSRSNH